jgi:hypothetical protein
MPLFDSRAEVKFLAIRAGIFMSETNRKACTGSLRVQGGSVYYFTAPLTGEVHCSQAVVVVQTSRQGCKTVHRHMVAAYPKHTTK